jgi:lysophospholipase L1-like esterase
MATDRPPPGEIADPYLLTTEDTAKLLRNAPWSRFAGVGDSIVEGITEAVHGYATLSWFDRVGDDLGRARPDLVSRNFGKKDMLAAQVSADQLEPALDFAPDLVAVVAGGNDILQREFDPQRTEAEIVKVVSAFVDRGAIVITMGLFDITVSGLVPEKYRKVMSERITLLSEGVRDIAQRLGALHIHLTTHPSGKEDIYSSDGLHLNARGQAIVAAEVIRTLGVHLGNV